jgi:hypothetical protein
MYNVVMGLYSRHDLISFITTSEVPGHLKAMGLLMLNTLSDNEINNLSDTIESVMSNIDDIQLMEMQLRSLGIPPNIVSIIIQNAKHYNLN